MQVQCCVCKKFRINEIWVEKEPDNKDKISHTYCPSCAKIIMNNIKQRRGEI